MRTILAVAIAVIAIAFTNAAHADVRIANDPGGAIISFVQKYREMARRGERVVIDGPCLSACTLLTGIIPPKQVCVTQYAALGFHAASLYDDATNPLVPTRWGTRIVMSLYPPAIRAWINKHGGLKPRLIYLRGAQLRSFYQACK